MSSVHTCKLFPFVVAGYTGDVVVLKQFSMTFAIDFSTSVLGSGENIGQLAELFYASTDCQVRRIFRSYLRRQRRFR
jgi:hypothetical protein